MHQKGEGGDLADDTAIRKAILALLSEEYLRLTPSDLVRAVHRKISTARRREIRQALRALVTLGSIVYSQHNSTTHLEINYQRPVQISDHIVLTPPGRRLPEKQDCVFIKLLGGTAFGGGEHPTTRMMLQGLDVLLKKADLVAFDRALDIGTGTGVLAIAAAALGFGWVDAVDIDPAACYEARQNVFLNGVDHGVHISQDSLDPFLNQQYDLILANLRPPTITELIPRLMALSSSRCLWIISGCRLKESERLKQNLPTRYSNVIWQQESTGWAAFAVYGA
jgi:ribosomal protein L11 methyltransferase